ncbi:hypothetical protein AB0383_05535 [Amycolatopsis sp. NPDC051373]|uniref:DUF7144 family membrane protein n=1 Tax=Amycolatopsis sp. NPDC051373 TaxID=3155801 RepID=UPI00345024ED
MSDHAVRPAAPAQEFPADEESGWARWIFFGATMMLLLGSFTLVEGLTALLDPQYYAVTAHGTLLFNLTGWGWVHLVLGVAAVVTGLGLLARASWARYPGIAIAGLSALAHLTFLPAAPFWALVVLTLDVLVIWALVAHAPDALRTRPSRR